MINRYSPKKEAAFRFLLYMASRPYNELINRQADALSPVKKYCYTKEFLLNPEHPEEDYNDVWRYAMERAKASEFSSLLKGSDLAALNNQLDLVKNNLKPVPEAMRDAQDNTNAQIKRNIEINPVYAQIYRDLKAGVR